MREKGKNIRDKIILIRVNRKEKKMAEVLAKEQGENTSEFFRRLLRESKSKSLLEINTEIIRKHKMVLREYKKILREIRGINKIKK